MGLVDTRTTAAISAGLRSRRGSTFDTAVSAAVALGADGDALLAEALPLTGGFNRVLVAAALGQVGGPLGASALRQALRATGSGSRDLACAAALALAKRREPSATGDLLATLAQSRDGTVREYALVGLAHAGDGQGWGDVLAWLTAQLRRQQRPVSHEPASLFALAYLLMHVDGQRTRLEHVATTLHSNRDRVASSERSWLSTYWPQLGDSLSNAALSPPSPNSLRECVIASTVQLNDP